MVVKQYQWVTFPLQQENKLEIEWWDKRNLQSASYYVDKCWYGPAFGAERDANFYTRGVQTKHAEAGVTLIFIAAEYIEDRTSGAPHLSGMHIVDRMQAIRSAEGVRVLLDNELPNQATTVKYTNVPEKWAMIKVDTRFHYGQTADKKVRWLVYHAGLGAREMFQHRFRENTLQAIAKCGIDLSSDVTETVANNTLGDDASKVSSSLVSKALGALYSLICAKTGHRLHPFIDENDQKKLTFLNPARGMLLDPAALNEETKNLGGPEFISATAVVEFEPTQLGALAAAAVQQNNSHSMPTGVKELRRGAVLQPGIYKQNPWYKGGGYVEN